MPAANLVNEWEDRNEKTVEQDYTPDRIRNKVRDTHKQVLLSLLSPEEPREMKEIYPEYCGQVPHPKTRRSVRNYLSQLQEKDKVRKSGTGTGTVYIKTHETSKSRVAVLIEDETLEEIKGVEQDLEAAFNTVLRKGLQKT